MSPSIACLRGVPATHEAVPSLRLLLIEHLPHPDPRRRPFLGPGLVEGELDDVLDRLVDVRHERYQSEACAEVRPRESGVNQVKGTKGVV